MRARRAASCLLLVCLLAVLVPGGGPALAQGGTTYTVQAGDNLGNIAYNYGTTVDAIVRANGLPSADFVYVGQTLTIPVQSVQAPRASAGAFYTVQLGDSLRSIADQLGVTAAALADANNLTNPDLLWAGQKLIVPGGTGGAPASNTATVNSQPAAQGTSAPANPASAAATYTVQPGDTLRSIAAQLGVTVADLADANGITDPDLLFSGQKLTVPGATQGATGTGQPAGSPAGVPAGASVIDAPTPTPADTPAGAPADAATPTDWPTPTATPGPADAPTPTDAPAGNAPATYTVQPGDTLRSIAIALGVSAADLATANGIDNPDQISVGQELQIPGATGGTSSAGATADSPTPVPTNGPTQPAPPQTYTVKAGETLGGIARKFNTSAAALARLNHLDSPDVVHVGMQLKVPSPSWTAPDISGPASRFVASISQQRCWLYQGNVVIGDWPCSSGKPGTDTHPGSYKIQSKMDKAFGSAWNIWMPYWLGIYWAGASEDGIHGIPWSADGGWRLWDGYVGTPVTYGCILLDDTNAKTLYNMAYIGMPVIIQP